MIVVAVTFVISALGYAWAFRPESAEGPSFLVRFAVPHALLALLALRELRRDGTLFERLRPRWGDLSIGAVTALFLLLASLGARSLLAPAGNPRQAWLLRIYLELGDPELIQRSFALTGLLLAIALAEEIIWRGMVLDRLSEKFGARRAWLLAAVLYALATFPTVYTLRDPLAGPNPLLVIAALGCGIVWTFLAVRLRRLAPGIISHMAFTYFATLQFLRPV